MIRLIADTTTEPGAIHPEMPAHQQAMIIRCPFLGPSVERGLTTWSAYAADSDDRHELLNVVLARAERTRAERRSGGPLVCHNMALFGPRNPQEAQRLMDWPSWIARNLYAPVQLVVDRFWIGQGRRPERTPIEPPPVSFFMFRSRIGRRERVIVSGRARLALLTLAGHGDDGSDVLAHALGKPCENPATEWANLAALFPPEPKTTVPGNQPWPEPGTVHKHSEHGPVVSRGPVRVSRMLDRVMLGGDGRV